MKADRIAVKRGERVEIYIRHADGKFTTNVVGPGSISIVRKKESAK